MSKEPVYCVIKTSNRALGGILSILLAVGGAVTATYMLKYISQLRNNDISQMRRREE